MNSGESPRRIIRPFTARKKLKSIRCNKEEMFRSHSPLLTVLKQYKGQPSTYSLNQSQRFSAIRMSKKFFDPIESDNERLQSVLSISRCSLTTDRKIDITPEHNSFVSKRSILAPTTANVKKNTVFSNILLQNVDLPDPKIPQKAKKCVKQPPSNKAMPTNFLKFQFYEPKISQILRKRGDHSPRNAIFDKKEILNITNGKIVF